MNAAALGVFLLAGLSDWLDGYLARRWNQRSPAGALLDPIADKVLVLGLFLAFVQLALVPAWMVLLIAAREFLITGVRLVAASRHVVLSAEKEGKHKTAWQMLTIFMILLSLALEESAALAPQTRQLLDGLVLGCLWVTLILTVASGAAFFWRHRDVINSHARVHRRDPAG
jgi:CDP-diacylglycerol--glycerol-3-phosphate 3-phosphatidyltransferase